MKPALVLALTSMLAAGAQQTPPNSQGEEKKLGAIDGIVVNAKTGEPVRRANVRLQPSSMPGMMTAGPAAPPAPYLASSDAEGKFRIGNVEPGRYLLMAERQGFVRLSYGARGRNMLGGIITIAPGQSMGNLRLEMLPHAVITGRVFDEEGEPLARVQIQVLRENFFQGKKRLMPQGAAHTDDTGSFRAADLAPGRYWLKAIYRNPMMMFEQPPRNSGDEAERQYVETFYPGTTDQAGATPIPVTAGQELPGMDIRMQKGRVYRVRGKVVGAAGPFRNVRLMLLPRQRDVVMMGPMGMGASVREDGTFEVGGVQPGAYFLSVFPMRDMHSLVGRVAVDVAQEDVENVVLPVGSGSTLQGQIRIDGDVQKLEREFGARISLASINVRVEPMEGMSFNLPLGRTKEDGSFVLQNLAPDRYRVVLGAVPKGTYLKSIRTADQDVLDHGLELSGGAGAQVQITLGIGTGQISGVVQDAKQLPAPGSTVTLAPNPIKEGRDDLFRFASTDQNGQFTMEGIAPGEYRVYAWEDIDVGAYTDPGFLKPYESKGQKITIKAGSQEQVTVNRIPAPQE